MFPLAIESTHQGGRIVPADSKRLLRARNMLSVIVPKLKAPVMKGAAEGCIKCVYLVTNSRRKRTL